MDLPSLAKKVIQIGAPILGAGIGGPMGASIASGIASFLGLSSSDPATIITALSNPSVAEKILELEKLSYARSQDAYADVANARQRDVETSKNLTKADWVMHFMVIMAWSGYYLILILGSQHYIVFTFDKTIVTDLKDLVLGISGFYFGNLFRRSGGGFTNVQM